MPIPPGNNVLTWICGEYADSSSTFSRCPQIMGMVPSQTGLQGPPGALPASSHPFSSFQIVGIADQNRVPITQGFLRLPQLFQQRGERTTCQGVRRTVHQSRLQQVHPLNP